MRRQGPVERLGKERRSPEEKRRLLDEGLAAERGHQPFATLEDVPDQAEGVSLVGLPWLVADEPENDPGRQESNGKARAEAA